jgi:hypothetical protein
LRSIGGEFELNPAYFDFTAAPKSLPSYRGKHEVWTNSGRSAIRIAIGEIVESARHRVVWLPSFLCPVITREFINHQFDVHYYSISKELSFEPPSQIKSGDVFLFIHYFGFPNEVVNNWIKTIDKSIVVIEDAVMSSLSGEWSSVGHYVIRSLRKVLPIPDGAVLTTDRAIHPMLVKSDEAVVSRKLVGRFFRYATGKGEVFLDILQASEDDLDRDLEIREMAIASRTLLARVDIESAKSKRRGNYQCLLGLLKDIEEVRPVFPELPDNVVPLGLPITMNANQRDHLRTFLMEGRVFCAVHWSLDSEKTAWTVSAHDLSDSILTLVIDQRYETADMVRQAGLIKKFFELS